MRHAIGTVILTLTCTALIVVILWRWLLFDYFEERYPAMLYFAQIRAYDEKTSRPIDFEVKWDYEMISPLCQRKRPCQN